MSNKYGPNNQYPKRTVCGECQQYIYIHWSSKGTEYATENERWERGTQGAIFHKCFNWDKKAKTEGKAKDTPPTVDQKLSMKDRLVLVEKQLKKLTDRMDDFEKNWS